MLFMNVGSLICAYCSSTNIQKAWLGEQKDCNFLTVQIEMLQMALQISSKEFMEKNYEALQNTRITVVSDFHN